MISLRRFQRGFLVGLLFNLCLLASVGCGEKPQGGGNQTSVDTSKSASVTSDSAKPKAPAEPAKSGSAQQTKVAAVPEKPKEPENLPAPVQSVDEAVAAIKKLQGRLTVDDKDPAKPIVKIRLQGKPITDAVLANVAPLKTLKAIEIVYPNSVTGEGMRYLKDLTNVETVFMEGTKIGDKGMEYLKGLTNLKRADLINVDMTDAGMPHFAGLTKLEQLCLTFNNISDAGLEHLNGLKTLKSLELDDTKVTQLGIDKFKQAVPKCRITASTAEMIAANAAAAAKSKKGAAETKVVDAGAVPPGVPAAPTGDWPQWQGPNRDALCGETGLLHQWPEEGPKQLWELKGIGWGYSTVAIQGGKAIVAGGMNGKLFLTCFDPVAGTKLWNVPVSSDGKSRSFATPTLDGDRVYCLSWDGILTCCKASDGSEIWHRDYIKEFGGTYMGMNAGGGYSESVLIDGNTLVCTPGAKDAALAGLNKMTGETIWKAAYPADVGSQGHDAAGMSSIVLSNACGVKQYVQLSGRGLISVAAETGKTLWAYNGIANTFANISTPIVAGDFVFASTVQGSDRTAGSALVKVVPNGDGLKAEQVYRLDYKVAANHHGGMVHVGDYIYMGHGYNRGFPLCLEMKTGKIIWRPGRGPGTGSAAVLYADGKLYFRYEDGVLALIEAKPDAYVLKSQFQLPPDKEKDWSHPVIWNGQLFLRGQDRLLCYNVKQP